MAVKGTLTLKSFKEIPPHVKQFLEDNPDGNKKYIENPRRSGKPVHPRAHTVDKSKEPFIVQDHAGVTALKYWLQSKKYNTFIETNDKNGNTLYGLLWDYDLGSFPSNKQSKRGLIVVIERNIGNKTGLVVANGMSTETEYGRLLKKSKHDLYTYGRE